LFEQFVDVLEDVALDLPGALAGVLLAEPVLGRLHVLADAGEQFLRTLLGLGLGLGRVGLPGVAFAEGLQLLLRLVFRKRLVLFLLGLLLGGGGARLLLEPRHRIGLGGRIVARSRDGNREHKGKQADDNAAHHGLPPWALASVVSSRNSSRTRPCSSRNSFNSARAASGKLSRLGCSLANALVRSLTSACSPRRALSCARGGMPSWALRPPCGGMSPPSPPSPPSPASAFCCCWAMASCCAFRASSKRSRRRPASCCNFWVSVSATFSSASSFFCSGRWRFFAVSRSLSIRLLACSLDSSATFRLSHVP